MTDRPPSVSGLEEHINYHARNGHISDSTRRHARDKPREGSESSQSSTDVDGKQSVTRPPTAKLPLQNDLADGQTALRHPFSSHLYHSSSTSRSPSTRTSSSSLQALNEDIVVDARSDLGAIGRGPLPRRSSHLGQSDTHSPEYPVYPDQSYAVLQSQVHPTFQHPSLRSRNSYPSRIEVLGRFAPSRASRTAGNTPASSPGLFSVRHPLRSTSSLVSDDEGPISSPFLHPTHLQPPKE